MRGLDPRIQDAPSAATRNRCRLGARINPRIKSGDGRDGSLGGRDYPCDDRVRRRPLRVMRGLDPRIQDAPSAATRNRCRLGARINPRIKCGDGRDERRARPRRPHAMYCPPLAVSVDPVIKPDSSEARNTTQRAISSDVPSRRTGICGRITFSNTSAGTAAVMSVAM